MDNSDYKNDNEAASGLAKVTNAVGRVLMSPINMWNSMEDYERAPFRWAAWSGLGFVTIVAGCVGVYELVEKFDGERSEAAILQEMDKIQYEQVVDIGNGQYGATEMSAEDTAALRAQAEKALIDTRATSKWKTVCFDDVAYIVEEKGWDRSSTKAITAKIDPDTLLPERCEVEAPKM